MAIDSLDFRRVLGQFATGITVVTTQDAEGCPAGLTVNAFCSVSLDPPLVLVCLDNRSEVTGALRASRLFGVSVLAEDQEPLSRRFAVPGPEKFTEMTLAMGDNGIVLIPGALAHLECRLAHEHEAGDHTIYVGEVLSLSAEPGRPLLFHGSAYRRLNGDAPIR